MFVDIHVHVANLFCFIDIADLVFIIGNADRSSLVNVAHTLLVFNVLLVVLIVVVRVACLGPTRRGWLVLRVLLVVLIVVDQVACLGPTGRGWQQSAVPVCDVVDMLG